MVLCFHLYIKQADEPDLLSIISMSKFVDEDGSSFSNPLVCSPDDSEVSKCFDGETLKRKLFDEGSTSSKKKKDTIVVKMEKKQ